MSEVMHGNEEESNDVRACLQNSIQRVEGDRSPRSQGERFVILVMQRVHILVQKLVCVQFAMHPIDTHFKNANIQKEVQCVESPTSNIGDVEVSTRITSFN